MLKTSASDCSVSIHLPDSIPLCVLYMCLVMYRVTTSPTGFGAHMSTYITTHLAQRHKHNSTLSVHQVYTAREKWVSGGRLVAQHWIILTGLRP